MTMDRVGGVPGRERERERKRERERERERERALFHAAVYSLQHVHRVRNEHDRRWLDLRVSTLEVFRIGFRLLKSRNLLSRSQKMTIDSYVNVLITGVCMCGLGEGGLEKTPASCYCQWRGGGLVAGRPRGFIFALSHSQSHDHGRSRMH